jgi:hypothetical protein
MEEPELAGTADNISGIIFARLKALAVSESQFHRSFQAEIASIGLAVQAAISQNTTLPNVPGRLGSASQLQAGRPSREPAGHAVQVSVAALLVPAEPAPIQILPTLLCCLKPTEIPADLPRLACPRHRRTKISTMWVRQPATAWTLNRKWTIAKTMPLTWTQRQT